MTSTPGASQRWLPKAGRPRRPAQLDRATAEEIGGGIDPQTLGAIAHMTADVVVRRGRASADPDVLERLITLVDREGIDAVAGLWADSPSNTLPGALWRMYQLRDWVRSSPRTFALHYRMGMDAAPVEHAVAGASEPPAPDDVVALADQVLAGVFAGELDVALDRAAAFCRVVATGATHDADSLDASGSAPDSHESHGTGLGNPDQAVRRIVSSARTLARTAEDLQEAAALWRTRRLD